MIPQSDKNFILFAKLQSKHGVDKAFSERFLLSSLSLTCEII